MQYAGIFVSTTVLEFPLGPKINRHPLLVTADIFEARPPSRNKQQLQLDTDTYLYIALVRIKET